MTAPTAETTTAEKATFLGAIRSEWIKFRGLRSNFVLVPATFLLIVANAILMPWAYVLRDRSTPKADYDPYPEMLVDKTAYIGLILAVLATLFITNEYRAGQIKTTLLSVPKRVPVLGAKAIVLFAIAFVVATVSSAIGYAVAPAILATGGYEYPLSTLDAVRLIVGSGLYLGSLTLIGLALGTLIRNSVASVLAVLALTLIVPVVPRIFSAAGAEVSRYFPIEAGGRLLTQPDTSELDPWTGLLVLVTWAVASMVAAAVVLKRRDA